MSLRGLNLKSRACRLSFVRPQRFPVSYYYRRSTSTASSNFNATREPSRGQGVRVTKVVGALIALGIGSTAYGLYDFYNTLTLWPSEVRSDLRAGLKSRNQGNLGLSERYLRRAYETALGLPSSTFDPSSYLKLSGIAITLASVLEADNQPKEAWDVYVHAISLPQTASPSPPLQEDASTSVKSLLPQSGGQQLTPQEILRQVSIAYKLSEMAEMYKFGEDEEKKWLTWAVEKLLGLVRSHSGGEAQMQEKSREEIQVPLADLNLPEWVTKTDLTAPLEALGAFYARQGNVEYAMPLYLQVISLLMPSSPEQLSSLEHRCRGAQIMNNLSSLIVTLPPTPSTQAQAELWARKSASICGQEINNAKLKKGDEHSLSVCETTLAAALFNIASLRDMAGDRVAAKELFSNSLDQSQKIGMKDGIMEAEAALRRLDRADGKPPQKTTP